MLTLSYNCDTPHLSHLGQTILHGTNCMTPFLLPSIFLDSSPEVSCLQEIWQRVDPKEEEEEEEDHVEFQVQAEEEPVDH